MRNHDDAEFTEFVESEIRRLRRTAYLICGDWHRAEDAAQDALVKIYRRWQHLNRADSLTNYAHRVVVNAVYDQFRRPWQRERLADDSSPEAPSPDAISPVDERMLIVQALGNLPPGQRACVVLRHYADLSVEQTAEVLGIHAGGVKSQTSRGLAHLRKILDQPRFDTARSAS